MPATRGPRALRALGKIEFKIQNTKVASAKVAFDTVRKKTEK